MSQLFQRLIVCAAVLALALPPSAFAENRNRGRTDLEKLAAELEQRLGRGSVIVSRDAASPSSRTAPTHANVILAAMNRERAAHGLGPLRLNERLTLAAGDRVGDMLAKRYFAHVSPDGVQPFTWVDQRGYRYRIIGENLAVGYRGTAVVDGWMRSPGHRENILQKSFDEVGIAITDSVPQRGYRGPLVVAMYGAR
jgi:uncharacterized protein YkwD